MHLNHLLRSIVDMLPHASEADRAAHMVMVDEAVPPPADADGGTATTTPTAPAKEK